jgi:hypothetical protein
MLRQGIGVLVRHHHHLARSQIKAPVCLNQTGRLLATHDDCRRSASTTTATPKQATFTEGDIVPQVIFKTRTRIESTDANPFDWKDMTTDDFFKGKRVVMFALPGAFTPTCSSTHVPGYHAAYSEILKEGVDEIYCLSVNDAFVMRQWGLHLG